MIPDYLLPPVQTGAARHHLLETLRFLREIELQAKKEGRSDVAAELVSVRGHVQIALDLMPPAVRKNTWRLRKVKHDAAAPVGKQRSDD